MTKCNIEYRTLNVECRRTRHFDIRHSVFDIRYFSKGSVGVSACHRKEKAGRGGFTLLEILLVITLIILVAALSWPNFEAWFQDHRLKQGVEDVREEWTKAHTLAM